MIHNLSANNSDHIKNEKLSGDGTPRRGPKMGFKLLDDKKKLPKKVTEIPFYFALHLH